MRKQHTALVALLMLGGCTGIFEPHDAVDRHGPITYDATDPTALQAFKAAYSVAAFDDLLFAKGWAAPGKAPKDKPETLPFVTVDFGVFPKDVAAVQALNYSPQDYCAYSKAEADAAAAAAKSDKTKANAAKAVTDAIAKYTAAMQALTAATTDAAKATAAAGLATAQKAVTDALAAQTSTNAAADSKAAIAILAKEGSPKPGCTYQSQHARAVAKYGFALIDQYCDDFFRSKGLFQQQITVGSDISSTFGSLGAGAAGAATGGVTAPVTSSLFTAIVSGGTSLANKDLLFGQSNISTTYDLIRKALGSDTTSSLPEPDNSDWTFQRAIQAVRGHQAICHPSSIVAMIQGNTANATPQSKSASPAGLSANINPDTGAPRPADSNKTQTTQ
jgi:hypothetical protein